MPSVTGVLKDQGITGENAGAKSPVQPAKQRTLPLVDAIDLTGLLLKVFCTSTVSLKAEHLRHCRKPKLLKQGG